MEKYKRAMRRALHTFNCAKRLHHLTEAISAINCIHGITMVALADDQISIDDYGKMTNLYGATLKKMWDI